MVTKQYLGHSTFQLGLPDSGCHWKSIVWQKFCLMILPRIEMRIFICWGTSAQAIWISLIWISRHSNVPIDTHYHILEVI